MVSQLGSRKKFKSHPLVFSLTLCYLLALSGCINVNIAGLGNTQSASNFIVQSLTGQKDALLVYEALPNYLLLIDTAIVNDPSNSDFLLAGAGLYGLYSLFFIEDPVRNVQLASRGLEYAEQLLCISIEDLCNPRAINYQEFQSRLESKQLSDIDTLYTYSLALLSYIKATGGDWQSIAFLPWAQRMLEQIIKIDELYNNGSSYVYLGILDALRPPALGGDLGRAEEYFNRAIDLSGGRNLSAKVNYARYVARGQFNQALHDRLLQEVIDADIDDINFNFFNTLAKHDAYLMLEQSESFFN